MYRYVLFLTPDFATRVFKPLLLMRNKYACVVDWLALDRVRSVRMGGGFVW